MEKASRIGSSHSTSFEMPKPQQQNQERESIFDAYARAKWMVQFPALTLIVFFRRDLGYRLVSPLRLFVTNGILFVVGVLAQPGNEEARPICLAIFAAISFTCGMVQKAMRMFEMGKGPRQHSYYIGTSPLNFHWLPASLLRNRRVERFVDPLICTLIGFACLPLSHALAGWIIFSALCLRCYEFIVQVRETDAQLDTADSLIEAAQQEATMQKMETVQNPQSHQQEAGIPTGLGEDLRDRLRNRTPNRDPGQK
jgi:hypothetical protein